MIPGVNYDLDRKSALAALETWLGAIRVGLSAGHELKPVAILSGPPGTGKTHTGRAIEQMVSAARGGSCDKCQGAGVIGERGEDGRTIARLCICARRVRAAYIPVLTPLGGDARPGLFDLFADEAGYDRGARAEARAALNTLADVGLLIVDELGGERDGGTTFLPGLLRLLDARNFRFTLFLTNLDSRELAARYEPRLVSRLLGAAVADYYEFGKIDRRNKGVSNV